jgi:hypothetical protein
VTFEDGLLIEAGAEQLWTKYETAQQRLKDHQAMERIRRKRGARSDLDRWLETGECEDV